MKLVIDDSKLFAIADSIRAKNGTTELIGVDEMPGGILDNSSAQPDMSLDMSVEPNQIKMLIFLTDENEEERSCAVSFVQTGPHGVEIDWGDGNREISDEQIRQSLYSITRYNHVYQKGGLYVITLTAIDGELKIHGNSYASGTMILNSGHYSNYYYEQFVAGAYKRRLVEMAIGDNIFLEDYALYNLPNLRKINRITTTPTSNILLKGICIGMSIIEMPEGISSIKQSTFVQNLLSGCVKNFIFPSTIKEIESSALNNTAGVLKYDFTKVQLNEDGELPFTIQSNSLKGFDALITKIVFANSEIAEVAKSTTNLSQYADSITYEGAE